MAAKTVKTTIWQGDQVVIVEDIPAHVCGSCMEQFYDAEVSEALRRLAEDGFPLEAAKKEILVPIFSLEGRIKRWKGVSEEPYVDY